MSDDFIRRIALQCEVGGVPGLVQECLAARDRWLEEDGDGAGRIDQMPPPETEADWFTWLLLAGRGSGKTRSGAEDAWWFGFRNPGCRYAVVAPTSADARKTCFEGESGLIARCPPGLIQNWNRGEMVLTLVNGSMYQGYSAEEPDRLRGPQHHRAWCDELAAWQYLDETLDNLIMGLRLGRTPRVVATTTPRPIKRIKEIISDPTTKISRVSTRANIKNLPRLFVDVMLRRYEGTRLGRQELDAEVLEDVPGALWSREALDADRCRWDPARWSVVHSDGRVVPVTQTWLAVDPMSGGLGQDATKEQDTDEVGMVVVGMGEDGHAYALHDATLGGNPSPDTWGRAAVEAHDTWRCLGIVYEANQGGEMVRHTLVTSAAAMRAERLRSIDFVATQAVWASQGKVTRAEPVSALYEQHRVHHCGTLARLEDQMCEFTRGLDRKKLGYSPDRVDALVWGVTHLLLTDSAGLNVQDYYRQEQSRHQQAVAQARPGTTLAVEHSTSPTTTGGVLLRPPHGVSTAFGILGNMYAQRPDGLMEVHQDDVPPFLRAGFTRPDDQERAA